MPTTEAIIASDKLHAEQSIHSADDLLQYIHNAYDDYEPVFPEDIAEICSNVAELLDELVEKKKLNKDYDVYFCDEFILPEEVAYHKYLGRRGRAIGYFSDFTAANLYTLTTQVPFIQDITTNLMLNEPEDKKRVVLGHYGCILHKPRAVITRENRSTLSFLDMLSKYRQYSDLSRKETGVWLKYHADRMNVTPECIKKWIQYYPECIELSEEVCINGLFT